MIFGHNRQNKNYSAYHAELVVKGKGFCYYRTSSIKNFNKAGITIIHSPPPNT